MPAILRTARSVVLVLTTLACTLGAVVAVTAPAADAATGPRATRLQHALRVARHQIGDPYRYGADGPGAFDCSGLTYFALHKRAGIRHFPRTSSAQARFTRHIRRSHMRKGDLMFFTDGGHVYHVGIFDGWRDGRRLVLHAPHTGSHVKVEKVWTNSWFAGTTRR
ncbi:MAG: C40 family peptidase [Marmoricola sp.]